MKKKIYDISLIDNIYPMGIVINVFEYRIGVFYVFTKFDRTTSVILWTPCTQAKTISTNTSFHSQNGNIAKKNISNDCNLWLFAVLSCMKEKKSGV